MSETMNNQYRAGIEHLNTAIGCFERWIEQMKDQQREREQQVICSQDYIRQLKCVRNNLKQHKL